MHIFVVDISYEQDSQVLKRELRFSPNRIVIFYDLDENSTHSIAISPLDDDGVVTLIAITIGPTLFVVYGMLNG